MTSSMSRFYDDKSTIENNSIGIEDYLNCPQVNLETAIEPIIDILPNIMNYIQIAKEICLNPSDGLTTDESASIYLYTLEDVGIFRKLNEIIENKQQDVLRLWFLYLKLFHIALSKLPSQERQIWRGINKDITIDNPDNFEKGKIFTWWRIISCSTNVKVVQAFMQEQGQNTLIMINCKNGKYIHRHSSYPDEEEIILLPGTQLKVVGDPFKLNDLHIIHLDEIERCEKIVNSSVSTSLKKFPNGNNGCGRNNCRLLIGCFLKVRLDEKVSF